MRRDLSAGYGDEEKKPGKERIESLSTGFSSFESQIIRRAFSEDWSWSDNSTAESHDHTLCICNYQVTLHRKSDYCYLHNSTAIVLTPGVEMFATSRPHCHCNGDSCQWTAWVVLVCISVIRKNNEKSELREQV